MYVLLDNDYSIRVYQSFVGIMLNAFSDLLCSADITHITPLIPVALMGECETTAVVVSP